MRIKGQNIKITNTYLILKLNDPYWGAWKRYGWVEGTEGYSISKEAFSKAMELKKKILIRNKYGDYEITTSKASRFLNCSFIARDGTELICLPKTAFKRLPKKEEEQLINTSLAMAQNIDKNKKVWKATGIKLHSTV